MLLETTALLVTALTFLGGVGDSVAPETASSPRHSMAASETSSPALVGPGATSVTAIASVSAPPSGVTPAPVLAPATRVVTGANAAAALLAPTRGHGATFIGSAGRVDTGLISRLGGRALLDQLALLPTHDIVGFVAQHPDAVARLLAHSPSPTAVARWWAGIPASSRVAMISGAPGVVGNLEGLDAGARDEANRTFLRQSIAEATAALPGLGRAEKADAEKRIEMLQQIEKSLITTADEPDRTLLSIDTAWPGRAAVVVGDLQNADYVSYMVPGMFFTVTGQMVDWTVISQDLYDEQVSWVDRLGATDAKLAGKSVAVVSWIGYQTPGVADIVSLDLARGGAGYISSAVDGLHAAREDDEPYVTLVTHSYGSTATMMALRDGSVEADALVMIGSPGSAAQSVREIGMPKDRVFVGEAAGDPVVNTAFFGSDPGSASFGATEMDVAAEVDPVTGHPLTAAEGHLGYFDAGTTAMRNMALVGLGRGDLVAPDGSTPTPADDGRPMADGR